MQSNDPTLLRGEPVLNCSRIGIFTFACLLVMPRSPLLAQTSDVPPLPQAQQPTFTFKTTTRIVLTDVTVTDVKGNPVYGLKQADFHIFDNGKPQKLLSFKEHRTMPVASLPQVSSAPGVYSNSFLEHLPPVLNIIVIDTTNLEIVDQMYLNYKLTQFIKRLPAGEPLAVYWRTGPYSILLQNFTSNHALLLAAVHKALPHFPPTGREYYSDLATLYKIALDFGQYPGRKNILWFTGGSTLFLRADPMDLGGITYLDPNTARIVYDLLESGRIAVYPVDARGLTGHEGFRMLAQHGMMSDTAEATGGHAYYDNNGLDLIAEHWLKTSGSFYTLTYSPSDFEFNNKWHKVTVTLDTDGRKYYLSYRRGYFADGTNTDGRSSKGLRTRLLADGTSVNRPDIRSVPIIFQAKIEPASQMSPGWLVVGSSKPAKPKRGTIPYVIRYQLPAKSFATNVINGKTQIVLGVGVIAFNQDGSREDGVADRVSLTVNPENLRRNPGIQIPIDQHIDLHKGQSYLYLAAWDMNSGRVGTLQVPVQVAAPK